MIEKMKVVHIVTTASEKAALLDRLRELGVVHFAEKADADQRYSRSIPTGNRKRQCCPTANLKRSSGS